MPLHYVGGPLGRFQAQVTRLKDQATAIHLGTLQTFQRPWQVPDKNGWAGDVNNISDLNKAYDRAAINTAYIQTMENAANKDDTYGRIGEAMNAKFQCDYLACQERAYRTRLASGPRSAMHAAGRRYGHGASTGIMDRMIKVTQDLAAASAAEQLPDPH